MPNEARFFEEISMLDEAMSLALSHFDFDDFFINSSSPNHFANAYFRTQYTRFTNYRKKIANILEASWEHSPFFSFSLAIASFFSCSQMLENMSLTFIERKRKNTKKPRDHKQWEIDEWLADYVRLLAPIRCS